MTRACDAKGIFAAANVCVSRPVQMCAGAFLMACAAGILCVGPLTSARAASMTAPETEREDVRTIEVGVGTSEVIDPPWPVARVSLTKPDVADVQVLTPTQVMLSARQIGSTDLILWSEQEEVRHYRVNVTIDLQYVQEELAQLFPDAELKANQSRDLLVVTGKLRKLDDSARLQALLDAYGVKNINSTIVAGVQQVQLQVRVAEVSRRAMRSLGFNALVGGNDSFAGLTLGPDGPLVPLSAGAPKGTPTSGLGDAFSTLANTAPSAAISFFGGFPSADFLYFIQALKDNQYVRVLAEPVLVALSGETATFLSGGEFPVPVVQGTGTGGGSSITVEYREFGVRVEFRPIVLGDNTIRLNVSPEVSDLSDVGAVQIEGFVIPSLLTRKASTTLELKSGQSFAMAGLLNQATSARSARIPGLGDMPVLGALFRSVRYQRGETELIVMVTANLVEPQSDGESMPLPGEFYKPPNDWELFIDGRLESTQVLPPPEAERFRELGLNRLQGPGAWETHGQAPAVSYGQRPDAQKAEQK